MRRPDRKLLINFVTTFDPLSREARLSRPDSSQSSFEPPTDLYETDDALVVRMEIAGMAADAISLSLDEGSGRLTISGNRSQTVTGSRRRFYSVEIASGPFARVVQLPRPVRAEDATAAYDNGFLLVRLPLRADQPRAPRSVPID